VIAAYAFRDRPYPDLTFHLPADAADKFQGIVFFARDYGYARIAPL